MEPIMNKKRKELHHDGSLHQQEVMTTPSQPQRTSPKKKHDCSLHTTGTNAAGPSTPLTKKMKKMTIVPTTMSNRRRSKEHQKNRRFGFKLRMRKGSCPRLFRDPLKEMLHAIPGPEMHSLYADTASTTTFFATQSSTGDLSCFGQQAQNVDEERKNDIEPASFPRKATTHNDVGSETMGIITPPSSRVGSLYNNRAFLSPPPCLIHGKQQGDVIHGKGKREMNKESDTSSSSSAKGIIPNSLLIPILLD